MCEAVPRFVQCYPRKVDQTGRVQEALRKSSNKVKEHDVWSVSIETDTPDLCLRVPYFSRLCAQLGGWRCVFHLMDPIEIVVASTTKSTIRILIVGTTKDDAVDSTQERGCLQPEGQL